MCLGSRERLSKPTFCSGSLRCNAGSETLSLKKSSIDKHIKSSKHINGVDRIAKDKKTNSVHYDYGVS